jgi:anti-sigma regulatory factor (Ser/Thr protein kinase)
VDTPGQARYAASPQRGTPGAASSFLGHLTAPLDRWASEVVMATPPGEPSPSPPEPPFTAAPAYPSACEWPLCTFLELGPLPSAVPCARLHVRQRLWEWNLARLSECAELLVSELVTNAVAASQALTLAPPVRLWLLAAPARVLVAVWDAVTQPPVPQEAAQDAEGGRGLLLVDAMSKQWDWYFPQEGTGGKVVWALHVIDELS